MSQHPLRNDRYCVGVITGRLIGPRSFDKMSDGDLRSLQRAAAEHGVQSPGGADYFPALARFPGDPEAFCADRQEIKRVAKRRGLMLNGIVDLD